MPSACIRHVRVTKSELRSQANMWQAMRAGLLNTVYRMFRSVGSGFREFTLYENDIYLQKDDVDKTSPLSHYRQRMKSVDAIRKLCMLAMATNMVNQVRKQLLLRNLEFSV